MGAALFSAKREEKNVRLFSRQLDMGLARERLALTLCRKKLYTAIAVDEITSKNRHGGITIILSADQAEAQLKQMNGACTIPKTKNRPKAVSIQKKANENLL